MNKKLQGDLGDLWPERSSLFLDMSLAAPKESAAESVTDIKKIKNKDTSSVGVLMAESMSAITPRCSNRVR
jgi:hypothetical protein